MDIDYITMELELTKLRNVNFENLLNILTVVTVTCIVASSFFSCSAEDNDLFSLTMRNPCSNWVVACESNALCFKASTVRCHQYCFSHHIWINGILLPRLRTWWMPTNNVFFGQIWNELKHLVVAVTCIVVFTLFSCSAEDNDLFSLTMGNWSSNWVVACESNALYFKASIVKCHQYCFNHHIWLNGIPLPRLRTCWMPTNNAFFGQIWNELKHLN